MRYSRVQDGDMYITTTAVVLSETLKIVLCLIILFFSLKVSIKDYLLYLYNALIVEWKDTIMLSVPAIVYMIQNNLQYVAVSNLEAAVFQVSQLIIFVYLQL
jgi:UDP-sugar transporter A1/2/3